MLLVREHLGEFPYGLSLPKRISEKGPVVTPLEAFNAQPEQQFSRNPRFPNQNYRYREPSANQNYIGMRTKVPPTQDDSNMFHIPYINPQYPETPFLQPTAGFVLPQFAAYS